MADIINTTDAQFQTDVIENSLPVLVDFWAPWCGPCKMIAPILEDLAQEYDGKVQIVKLDITDSEIAAKYNVRSIPALYMFKHGEVTAQQIGALPRGPLAQFIEQQL
ncbi:MULTISPECIES: thioredoxin [unclassified Acinetobacter]|uniref:thioredoxin n=1 Tax=unclassified Acinetobacter TaxID=196816 RepID=UPI0035BB9CE5